MYRKIMMDDSNLEALNQF